MGMKKNVVHEPGKEVEVNYLFIKKGGFTEPAEVYILGADHKAYVVPNDLILRLLKEHIVISLPVTDRRRKRRIASIFERGRYSGTKETK